MIGIGNTFLMQDKSGTMHRWTVLQACLVRKEKMCVIVNISSKKCSSGKCNGTLGRRAHSFFSKISYVRCDHARVIPLKKLESLLKKGKIRLKDDFSPTILGTIRQVVLTCIRSSKEVKDLL